MTATTSTDIYTLSLHDALPISAMAHEARRYLNGNFEARVTGLCRYLFHDMGFRGNVQSYYDPRNSYLNRSEEHTSELQSLRHLVCRLLLEKKTPKRNATSRTAL